LKEKIAPDFHFPSTKVDNLGQGKTVPVTSRAALKTLDKSLGDSLKDENGLNAAVRYHRNGLKRRRLLMRIAALLVDLLRGTPLSMILS
jgi:hypothetical protein